MTNGYWVVSVDRETGSATTEFFDDRNAAWQQAIDIETPMLATMVVDSRNTRGANAR